MVQILTRREAAARPWLFHACLLVLCLGMPGCVSSAVWAGYSALEKPLESGQIRQLGVGSNGELVLSVDFPTRGTRFFSLRPPLLPQPRARAARQALQPIASTWQGAGGAQVRLVDEGRQLECMLAAFELHLPGPTASRVLGTRALSGPVTRIQVLFETLAGERGAAEIEVGIGAGGRKLRLLPLEEVEPFGEAAGGPPGDQDLEQTDGARVTLLPSGALSIDGATIRYPAFTDQPVEADVAGASWRVLLMPLTVPLDAALLPFELIYFASVGPIH